MKSILIISLFVVAVSANYGYAPIARVMYAERPATAQIVSLHQEIRENAANNVRFETSNGISSEDNTQIIPGPNPENPREPWNRIAKSGSYAYTSPEGVPVRMQWTADSNGFRVSGSPLPTSPPLPAGY